MFRYRVFAFVLAGTMLFTSCSNKSAPASNNEGSQAPANAPAQASQTPPPAPPAAPPGAAPTPAPAPQPEQPPQTTQAQPPVAPPPAPRKEPPPKPIVVPAGTVITVHLQNALSSKTNHQGDPFDASLAEPIVINGKRVVPEGATAAGTVTQAKSAGKFKGAASLDVVLDSLTVRGTSYKIQTTSAGQTSKGKGKRTAAMVGGGTGAGAIIGGVAGGGKGAAIGALAGGALGTTGAGLSGNNREISLPAEAVLSFKLTASLTLKPVPTHTQHTEVPEQ